MKKWILLIALLAAALSQAQAQGGRGFWHQEWTVEKGDSIPLVHVLPVYVFSRPVDLRRYRRLVDAVKKAQADGARGLGFIDVETTELAKRMDWEIAYPANEQLKFFMVADRLMFRHGEFPEYEEYYAQLDAHLAVDLAEVEKAADAFGLAFAQKHHDDKLHYFVGAGNQYGSTYSYAMCYWEEQHWIRTKSIHSSEFFHGMLEIVDRDTPVTVFVGEDSQRPLSERVVRFLPRVCANYTVIDSRDYALPGIDERFRGNLSHLVTHAVTQRIDAHIEAINCHPMEIRRYYRRLDY